MPSLPPHKQIDRKSKHNKKCVASCPPVCPSLVCLVCLFACPPVCLLVRLSVCLPACRSEWAMSVGLFACLAVRLPTCPPVLSVLSVCLPG